MNYVVNNGQLVCYKTRPSSRAKDTSGIRFQLLSSKPGFHIVPVEAHDSTGKSVLMPSLLDQVITVPSEVRTASQHLRALVAAINKVQPIRLEYGPFGFRPDDVDKAFRAQPPVFQWGVHSTVARDALIDLLNQSATSMPWHLMCQASRAQPWWHFLSSVAVTSGSVNRRRLLRRFEIPRWFKGVPRNHLF